MQRFLNEIESFGDIAAEDDSTLLDYFLSTEAASRLQTGKYILVLGRKGSGKTALVKHFTETEGKSHGSPLSLKNYPWSAHADLVDKGASLTEAYVASWRLLIAIRLASMVCKLGESHFTDTIQGLTKFLLKNFGAIDPDTRSILSQGRLVVTGLSVGPQIAGLSLGHINFGGTSNSKVLGLELSSLTEVILKDVSVAISELGISNLFLHFDELDQGLDRLDDERSRMLIGLILAARDISKSQSLRANISPIVYLRSDIWDQLEFSDKNKITQSSAIHLLWDTDSLKQLVDKRIQKFLGLNYSWDSIDDKAKMRGSQPKWSHIVSRTFLRPRDVIQFLNEALRVAKRRGRNVEMFLSDDINGARENYSQYLKMELDDEINPHWPAWSEGLQACSRVQTLTFQKEDFVKAYKAIRSQKNPFDAENALERLYHFSIISYDRRLAKGGSSWAFRYTEASAGWDSSAPRFKVHLGLKEYAKLKEERAV